MGRRYTDDMPVDSFPHAVPLYSRGHHEAKTSLLGGQPVEREYQPGYEPSFVSDFQPEPSSRSRAASAGTAGGHGYMNARGMGRGGPGAGAGWYKPQSVWVWAFIGVTSVQAAIVLAFESYVFALFQGGLHGHVAMTGEDYDQTIPTFLTLYIFGCVYELLLVWDALRLKNTIQIIGLVLYNIGLLIYAAVQLLQIGEATSQLSSAPSQTPGAPALSGSVWPAVRPFLIAIPVIIGIGTLCMAFVARKLYNEFAWTIYKHISADLRMKRRYLTYQIYIALLKFDFFFFLGFTIQFIVIVASKNLNTNVGNQVEFGLTIAAIPVTICILFLAAIIVRKENKPGMVLCIILYFAGMAYFLFKLVRMYQHNAKAALYLPARRSLTTFAILTLILIVATIINAIICASNFNKGLKPYLRHRKPDHSTQHPVPSGKEDDLKSQISAPLPPQGYDYEYTGSSSHMGGNSTGGLVPAGRAYNASTAGGMELGDLPHNQQYAANTGGAVGGYNTKYTYYNSNAPAPASTRMTID